MCGVVAFYVTYTNYYRRITKRHVLLGIISVLIFLGVAAIIRTGDIENITLQNIIRIGLFDTFAVHNSLKHYLIHNEIVLLQFPIMLINNLINILPLILMPDKASWLMHYKDINADIMGIQSAIHTFPQLMAHFGIIGSLLVAFSSPFILNYFKHSIYMRAPYVVIVGVIAAPFFRDYEVTLIKLFIQICIIMPLLYLVLCNFRLDPILKYLKLRK